MSIFTIGKSFRDLRRLKQITTVFVKEGLHFYLEETNLAKHAKISTRIQHGMREKNVTPERIRKAFEQLGPTFVKLGQILALRPDLIPQEYCDEFKRLQDNANPLPYPLIKDVIEQDLGKPLKDLFAHVDKIPLACASISQVHKAKLKTGEDVVIKIQRPGTERIVEQDIDILEYVAAKIDTRYPRFHAPEIVKEFKRYTENEFDFKYEARNTKNFRQYHLLKHLGKVPKVYDEFSTKNVLVLEYVSGIPFTDKQALIDAGFDLKALVTLGGRGIIMQGFDFGMFHADPHPGNLLAIREGKKQSLCLLDYGIVGFLDEDMQKKLVQFFDRLLEKDVEGVVQALAGIGTRSDTTDMAGLQQDVTEALLTWDNSNLGAERISNLFYKVVLSAIDHELDLPVNIVTVAKTLVTVEGSAIWLDKDYDLAKDTRPIIKSIVKEKFGPQKAMKNIFKDIPKMQDFAKNLPVAAESLMEKVREGKIDIHIEGNEFASVIRNYDEEMQKRNIVLFAGIFFIGSALLAGLAPALRLFGQPAYLWGFCGFAIVLLIFLRTTRKIHKLG